MADGNPSGSPLETAAATVGEGTTEAFELLGNETRLAILLALWEAIDPGPPPSESTLPFSEVRERVGIGHGRNFNYHLEKLVGEFVRKTDEGYTLTPGTTQILETVLAGTHAGHSSFEGGPVDEECPLCGAPVVVDYDEGVLVGRCTSCEGGGGDGTLWHTHEYPPTGLDGRTPGEVHRAARTLMDHRLLTMQAGVCPICAGTVTAFLYVCTDHDAADGTPCERCGLTHESLIHLSCDVCKHQSNAHPEWFADVIPAVRAFWHDHGIDPVSSEGREVPSDAKEFEVLSAEPPEVRLRIELDSDRLDVTLDEAARVVDVTESTT